MGILKDIENQILQDDLKIVIQELIDDEVEAVVGYEKAIQTLNISYMDYDGYKKAIETFEHIIAEEKEHIKELEELIK